MLLEDTKLRANALCEDIPLVWRKEQVLNSLLKDEKILPEIYESLHQEFDATLNKLKASTQDVIAEIDKQIAECNEKFKKLHSAKTHLEIESEIGEINEGSYKKSLEIILDGLKNVITEKNDLEALRTRLSSLLLGEEPAKTVEPVESVEPVAAETALSKEATTESPPSEPSITVRLK